MFNVNIIHHARIRQSLHIQLPSVQVGYFSYPNPDVTSGRNSQFSEASFALNPSWQHKKANWGFQLWSCLFCGSSIIQESSTENFNRTSRIYAVVESTLYSDPGSLWHVAKMYWRLDDMSGSIEKNTAFGGHFLWAVWSLKMTTFWSSHPRQPVICPGAVSCAAASSRPGNQGSPWIRLQNEVG